MDTPPSDGARTAAIAMSRMPVLVMKLGFSYLKFKRKAKRSAKAFRKGLVKKGMDKNMAKELAEAYELNFSIRELMKGQGMEIPGLSQIFN